MSGDRVIGHVPRPAKLDELADGRSYSVAASAGTGKTYLIQHLVADLVIEQGIELPRILIVTYTEKAAGELKLRVRQTLRAALTPSPQRPDEPCWEITEEKRARAAAALRDFDTATIGTIHQFCWQNLRELGVLAGLPPSMNREVVDEPTAEAWRHVLRRRIRHDGFARYWSVLTGWDRTQLEKGVCRIALSEASPRPTEEEIVADLEELREAWRALDRPETVRKDFHPFHDKPKVGGTSDNTAHLRAYRGFCRGVFSALAELDAGSLSVGDALLFRLPVAANLLRRKGNAKVTAFEKATHETKHLCRTDAQRDFLVAANKLCIACEGWAVRQLALDVRDRVRHLHEERGSITYRQMVSRLRDAIVAEDGRPGERPLLSQLRDRYAIGIVDEFQDTDDGQWAIFRSVFLREPDGSPRIDGRLFVVGDPKQAIYRFRGADVEAYRRAVAELQETAGTETVELDENWRSTPELLDALEVVLAPGLFAPDGIEYGRVHARADCQLDDPAGGPPLVFLAPPGWDDPDAERLYKEPLDWILAQGIAAEIKHLIHDAGMRYRKRGERKLLPLAPSDICVLGRNRDDLILVGRALRRAGIGYAQYKRQGLYATAEALDLLDVLIAVGNAESSSDVLRMFATSFFPIPARELASYRGLPPDHELSERFRTWVAFGQSGDIPALLRAIEEDSGVIRRLLFQEGERSAANMRQLFDDVLKLHAETGWMLPQITEEMRRRTQTDPKELADTDLLRLESEDDLVTLMTMHASKGLQYPIVFLAGGYSGKNRSFPKHPVVLHDNEGVPYLSLRPTQEKARWYNEQAQDDARLLYVAATRAEARLYLPFWGAAQANFHAEIYERVRPTCLTLTQTPHPLVEFRDAGRAFAEVPPLPGTVGDATAEALTTFSPPDPPGTVSAGEQKHWVTNRRGPQQTSFTGLARRREKDAAGLSIELGPGVSSFGQESDEVPNVPVEPPAEALSDAPGEEAREHDEVELEGADLLDVGSDDAVHIPGGADVGTAFHRAIENLDLATLRGHSFDDWWASAPDCRVDLQRVGFDDEQQREGASWIHRTLTTPFHGQRLQDGSRVAVTYPSFADMERVLPEVPFYLPIPEEAHARLGEAAVGDGRAFAVRRGWLTGTIDAVLRHDGRAAFVDWKTNRLRSVEDPIREDYSEQSVARYTREHYDLQIAIYTVALLRWLRVRDETEYAERFGGVFYFYLRGTGRADAAPGEGVFHLLPDFETVKSWEERLLRHSYRPKKVRGAGLEVT